MISTRSFRLLVLVLTMAFVLCAPAAVFAAGVNGHAAAASVGAQSLMAPDRYDGVDATWATAPTLPEASYHTFSSLPTNYLYTADEDWFRVTVSQTGTPVTINVERLSGQGGSFIDVYGSNGSGVCDPASMAFGGYSDPNTGTPVLGGYPKGGFWISGMAKLYFTAPHPGTYYFRHRSAEGTPGAGYDRDAIPNASKQAVTYQLHVVVGDADRLAGNTRYNTSVAVSQQMWNASDDPWWWEGPWGNGVILASGQNYPDGLAATSFALRSGMPILLTAKDSLPSDVASEIDRLSLANWWSAWRGNNRFTVYICGSDSAISFGVENRIVAMPHVTAVKRLEGTDRYGTAVAIADEASSTALVASIRSANVGAKASGKQAFVINGNAWADGLAVGPVAAFAHAPVLMVTLGSLPPATADWLTKNGIDTVHAVGGPSVVSTPVLDAIHALPGAPSVDRIKGVDRWETAYRVARFGVDLGMSGDGCTVVSGASPWDALSAGQVTFMTYTPLLLTPPTGLSPWVTRFRNDAGGFSEPSYVVGGEPAVGAAAYGQLRDLWKRP